MAQKSADGYLHLPYIDQAEAYVTRPTSFQWILWHWNLGNANSHCCNLLVTLAHSYYQNEIL